jgi:hypothetical protein
MSVRMQLQHKPELERVLPVRERTYRRGTSATSHVGDVSCRRRFISATFGFARLAQLVPIAQQPLMRDVGADPPGRAIHPLVDLLH